MDQKLSNWSGRAIRVDKREFILADVPPILNRPGVDAGSWIKIARHFRRHYSHFLGAGELLVRSINEPTMVAGCWGLQEIIEW